MRSLQKGRSVCAVLLSLLTCTTACNFQGVSSLPLPGAVGRGAGSDVYTVELRNVGTLESNAAVMIDDVVVGSVGTMRVRDRHAELSVSVRSNTVVPANAMATIGQTSLLGSLHLALDPPIGQAASGRLKPGSTIPLANSASYPSTEQTLAALSAVLTTGGLGQVGDIIHNLNAALTGRQPQIRDLLVRLNDLVGLLDDQRQDVLETLKQMDRVASIFADERDVIGRALKTLPGALDVLLAERAQFTTALEKLRIFSDGATNLVNSTQADLVANLQNLEPSLRALADVGPDLPSALAFATVFPLGQNTIDRAVRGDYLNLFVTADLTVNRLKRSLLLGTRWGQEGAVLVPAPGDPGYQAYLTNNPLAAALAPPLPPPAPPQAPPPAAPPPGPVSGGR